MMPETVISRSLMRASVVCLSLRAMTAQRERMTLKPMGGCMSRAFRSILESMRASLLCSYATAERVYL